MSKVEITIEKCGHCGAMPTEQEVCEAIRKDEEQRTIVCAVCTKKVEYVKRKLVHFYYDGKKGWLVEGTVEPIVRIFDYISTVGQRVEAYVHVECFKKAVPGAQFSR